MRRMLIMKHYWSKQNTAPIELFVLLSLTYLPKWICPHSLCLCDRGSINLNNVVLVTHYLCKMCSNITLILQVCPLPSVGIDQVADLEDT